MNTKNKKVPIIVFRDLFGVFEKNYKPIPLETFAKSPYKTLISTLLSSRTKDELTLKVSQKLFKKASNIKALSGLTIGELTKLIYPVGFYRTKAKQLNKLSEIVLTKYHGKIPKTREELMSLPGVGRKTANLVLNRAFDIPAIAVDTHVHRISNMVGWVKTKTPEKTEVGLMRILPKNYWSRVNRLFVSIGQQYRSKGQLENFLRTKNLL